MLLTVRSADEMSAQSFVRFHETSRAIFVFENQRMTHLIYIIPILSSNRIFLRLRTRITLSMLQYRSNRIFTT